MIYKANVVSKVIELRKENVLIKDENRVEDKLRNLIEDGPERLQVLADFDGTLTELDLTTSEGKKSIGSYSIFSRTKALSQAYHDGYAALWAWMMPIFKSREVPDEEKEEVIEQWFLEVEELTRGEKLTVKNIQEAVVDSAIPLRNGCDRMFPLLSDLGVPLTVVSAGMGDVIVHMLRDFKPKVVANFLSFEESGSVLGFTRPIVSVYNKCTIPLPVDKSRHNMVLLGDAPEDCRIGESIEDSKTVLKIGFFTGGDNTRLQRFLSCYDIVLVDDPTMDTVIAVLKMVACIP